MQWKENQLLLKRKKNPTPLALVVVISKIPRATADRKMTKNHGIFFFSYCNH